MSLTSINVGTEPNDGTGDPPRVAFQKINANSRVIDQALAATETTPQLNARDTANRNRANHTGTQTADTIADFAEAAAEAAPVQSVAGKAGAVVLTRADVGLGSADNTADLDKPVSTATGAALASLETATQAALSLKLEAGALTAFESTAQLNARDTANRARGNHTGSQPANTITGLAAVATSGAWADVSGKPPQALHYEQTAEPIAPSVGQVWRERNSGGQIVGEWEWSGSLWLSVLHYEQGAVNVGANITASLAFLSLKTAPKTFVSSIRITIGRPDTYDASNYNQFRLRSLTPSTLGILGDFVLGNQSEFLTAPANSIINFSLPLFSPILPLDLIGISVESTVAAGAPSGLKRAAALCSYRVIR
ncbi:hypothetical protein [Nodosilinea sp. E11]|uniref:hypothetical protein n=1 Tax=Nodosilinea sp. E11 TaxID=3037479 RepID=UPI0029350851|nr:hypothetical protein [Nodosilinea sp. E11]WOD37375.1 hypothetical protein RRF56_02660 [Nodosilinea sp. E11]WOD37937.1 hypothetical protein RRF56_17125 [Nodosilinea sp. E11]